MLAAQEKRKEIRRRLFNPVGGHVSDESEVVSKPEQRKRAIEALLVEDERKRDAEVEERWQSIINRLIATADKEAAELAEQEANAGTLTMEMIIRVVCGLFRIKRIDLMSQRRTAAVVYPRQLGMYLCRSHTTFSLPQVGVKFGHRDHTTVMHAFNKISTLLTFGDPKVTQDVARLRQVLGVE